MDIQVDRMALTPKRRQRRPQSGFTIIETLVAMSILLVGFLAMTTLHVSAMRGNSRARRQTLAMILAHQQIERFQRLGGANVTAGSDTAAMDGRSFARSWTVSSNPSISPTVQVTVSWTDQWGPGSVTIPSVVR